MIQWFLDEKVSWLAGSLDRERERELVSEFNKEGLTPSKPGNTYPTYSVPFPKDMDGEKEKKEKTRKAFP